MNENPEAAILTARGATVSPHVASPDVFDWIKSHVFDPLVLVKEGDRISLMANMNGNSEDNGKGKPWFLGKIEGIPVKILRTEDKRKKGWRFRIFVNGDPKPKEAREGDVMEKAKKLVIEMKKKLNMGGYYQGKSFLEAVEAAAADVAQFGLHLKDFLADAFATLKLMSAFLAEEAEFLEKKNTEKTALDMAPPETPVPKMASTWEKVVGHYRALRPSEPARVSTLVPKFLGHIQRLIECGKLEQKSMIRYQSHMGSFLRAFGSRWVHLLNWRDVQDWVHEGVDSVQAATAGQRLGVIKAFGLWAMDYENALPKTADKKTLFDFITLQKLRFKPPVPKEKVVIDFYRASTVRLVFDAALANPDLYMWIPVLVLWFFGGIHFAEILRLHWRDVLMHLRAVHIGPDVARKKHKAREVMFSPAAFSFIEEFVKRMCPDPDSLIVPGANPNGYKTQKRFESSNHQRFMRAFRQMLEKTGWKPDCEDSEAIVRSIRNGLRHSYATHLFHLLLNLEFVEEQLGTHDTDLFRHYIALVLGMAEAQEYFAIGHPDCGPFDPAAHWLPDEKYKTYAQALSDLNQAEIEDKKNVRNHFRK